MKAKFDLTITAIAMVFFASNLFAIQLTRVISRETTNSFERIKFFNAGNGVSSAIVRLPSDATSDGIFHIPSGSEDPQFEIQQAIQTISNSGSPGRIVLDGGTYSFDQPEHGAYLRIQNCVDLKIVGNDSKLVFPHPSTGFLVVDSSRIQISDLDLRYRTRVATEGIIVETQENGKAIRISSRYLEQIGESSHYQSCVSLYKRGESLPFDNRAMNRWLQNSTKENLGFDGESLYLPSSIHVLKDFEIGDLVTAKHFEYRANALTVLRCNDFSILRCCASNVPGMFVFSRAIGSGLLIDSNELRVDPDDELSKVSASNDGFHLNSSGKNVVIRNNRLARMGDDGLNLHHDYWNVLTVSGSSALIQLTNPFTGSLDLRTGSKIEFLSPGLRYQHEALVLGYERVSPNNTILVRFDRGLGNVSPGDLASLHQWQPRNFVIENNRFLDFWGRGMLIQSRVGLIENNEIRNLAGAGISITTDNRLFKESGPVRNVVINNNLIVNSSKSRLSQARNTLELGAISIATKCGFDETDSPRGFSESYLHRRIIIENNRIRNCGGPAVFLSSVRNIEVTENNLFNTGRIPFQINRPGRRSGVLNSIYKMPIADFHSKDSRIYGNSIQ